MSVAPGSARGLMRDGNQRMRFAARVLLTASICGCTSGATYPDGPRPAAPRFVQLAGCYRVAIGRWAETGQNMGLLPLTEFRLDTMVSSWRFAQYERRHAGPEAVRSASPIVKQTGGTPGVWYPVGKDSVRVYWNSGFATAGYRLEVRGDAIAGVALTHSDFRSVSPQTREPYPDPTAAVRGARVPCRE